MDLMASTGGALETVIGWIPLAFGLLLAALFYAAVFVLVRRALVRVRDRNKPAPPLPPPPS